MVLTERLHEEGERKCALMQISAELLMSSQAHRIVTKDRREFLTSVNYGYDNWM